MNDIRLENNGDGSFDWAFSHSDVEDVIGDQRLVSEVIHAILLGSGELEQYYYRDKGSNTRQFIGLLNTDDNLGLVCAELEENVRRLDGVQDAEVTLSHEGSQILIRKVSITKSNGGVMEIAI